jgi:hypothetical protein
VLNDFGNLGRAYVKTDEVEADEWTVVSKIMDGEYSNPARVVAFNIAEGWSRARGGVINPKPKCIDSEIAAGAQWAKCRPSALRLCMGSAGLGAFRRGEAPMTGTL